MNNPAHDPAHDADHIAEQSPAPEGAMVRTFVICNKKGLHARASAKFVQTVEKFDAEVRVKRNGDTVGGTSIMGLMMLAAAPGTSITVEATGRQAGEVIEALALLINSRFGEAD
jgi:phosphocarrier protein HPr